MPTPLPPAPTVGPPMPWMLGGTPFAPASVAPPALLAQFTPAQRAAMALDAAGLSSGGAGSTATKAVSQVVRGAPSFVGRGGLGAAGAGSPGMGAAGSASRAAAQTVGRGGAGVASRLAGSGAPTYLTQRLAGQSTAGLGMRSMAAGSLGRASLFGGAGYLGGQAVEGMVGHREGTWDDALRNATVGAGIGAGIGSIVPVIGTGIGAAIGGVGGGIFGALTGRGSDKGEAGKAFGKQSDTFNEAFDTYSVSPELRDQFMMQFQLATDGLGRGEVNEVAQQMRGMLPQLIMEDQAIQEEERGRSAMFAAAQAWMAPMMQQAMSRTNQYGDQLSQAMLNSAQQISDPASRAFAVEDARRVPLDIATQQAYAMQQMMSLPGLYGYQTQGDSNGVPQMDFTSILNATPVATPGGQTMPYGQMAQQPMQPMP